MSGEQTYSLYLSSHSSTVLGPGREQVRAPERVEAMCHQNNCLPTVDTVKRDLHQQSESPRSASISFSARAVVLFSGIEQTLHFMLVDIRDIKSC